jgi:hypothetical protein
MTPPIMAVLLVPLLPPESPPARRAGSVGLTVTMAVDTTIVTSVPVPTWEVYDVTFAEVIGVGVVLEKTL